MSSVSGITSGTTTKAVNKVSDMTAEQFLKLLVTQLQNQDPFEPVKNQDLLEQVSAVRQLQSNMDLSTVLSGLSLQQQIGSASAIIGKTVTGKNANLEDVSGVVTSVAVESDKVYLELDTGQRMSLEDVTGIATTTAKA